MNKDGNYNKFSQNTLRLALAALIGFLAFRTWGRWEVAAILFYFSLRFDILVDSRR